MPILTTDMKLFKTTNNLGGVITATQLASASLGALFANITGAEATSGVVKYACVYIRNKNATLTLTAVKQWLLSNTPSGDTEVKFGIGTSAKNGTEQTIANELTAPAGVSFLLAINEGVAIAFPDLDADDYQALWIELTVSPGASATALDNFIIRNKGDSPA